MIPLTRTAEIASESADAPAASRTGGRLSADERRNRLDIWSDCVKAELAARNMRPAQLAA